MRDTDLLQLALGLDSPWYVSSSEFNVEMKRLDVRIDFHKGSTFCCPECGHAPLKAYDTVEKSWRHLNFFQHEAHLTARVPRVACPQCGVRLIDKLPWARRESGFTLLFEAMIMTMSKSMPVNTIASYIGENDTRIWRVIHHYVDQARQQADYSAVTKVGVDETSSKRGHNCVTLFVDLEGPQILFVTEGKDTATVKAFRDDLTVHNGNSDAITEFCSDMSPAFIKGDQSLDGSPPFPAGLPVMPETESVSLVNIPRLFLTPALKYLNIPCYIEMPFALFI